MGVYSGNRTLLGESIDSVGDHIMEMVLENERNDMKMFNAVINYDFLEAYSEAGLATLNEAEGEDAKTETKKGIGKKIKEMFNKAIEAIKRFVSTFIAKVQNLFANDAKLYKQYGENFLKNGVGYKVTGWIPLKGGVDPDKVLGSVIDEFVGNTGKIDNAADTDGINKIVDEIKKKAKETNYAKNISDILFGAKPASGSDEAENGHPLTAQDVALINEIVKSSKRMINYIKMTGEYGVKYLKSEQTNLKYEKNMSEHDELSLAKINAKYKVATVYVSIVSKTTNAACNAYARYLAAARKAFVQAGKKAAGSENSSAVFDFVLGEASDDYVAEALAM